MYLLSVKAKGCVVCALLQVAVKVLGCSGSGTTSGVINGINWAVADCVTVDARKKCVGSMSLGGGASSTLDNAIAAATAQGVTMVVAAGNDGRDACRYSPARAPTAITVGATTDRDAKASWSNFGSCE
jgi:subtilisin family serine protease